MEANNNLSTPVVISQNFVDEIIYLQQDITNNKFKIGDILVLLVDTFAGRKQEVCNYLQGATRLEWKTLSDYETTARRWTVELREKYAMLDYSLFRNMNPEDQRDLQMMDEAVDNQLTTTKVLDQKYNRNSPKYMVRKALSILNKIDISQYREIEIAIEMLATWLQDMGEDPPPIDYF